MPINNEILIWIGGTPCPNETRVFLQPDPGQEVIHTTDPSWANIAVLAGVSKSKGIAKKTGWSASQHWKDTPPVGFSERRGVGKNKLNIFIFRRHGNQDFILDGKGKEIAHKSKDWDNFCQKWWEFLENEPHTRAWRLVTSI